MRRESGRGIRGPDGLAEKGDGRGGEETSLRTVSRFSAFIAWAPPTRWWSSVYRAFMAVMCASTSWLLSMPTRESRIWER